MSILSGTASCTSFYGFNAMAILAGNGMSHRNMFDDWKETPTLKLAGRHPRYCEYIKKKDSFLWWGF
jgi:hypothetical protein